MNRIKLIFLLSALVAIVAMALLFASPQPKPPEAGLSYAEVSRDDPSCEKDICLTEYIIVSNGMVLKVVRHESGQDVSLHVADPGKAVSAIRKISELQDPDTVFEKNAQQYHIYSFVDEFQKSYLPFDSPTAQQMQQIAEELYLSAPPSDQPFVQFVFWKQGEDIQDYHIFADGVAIHSLFRGDTKILNSHMSKIDEGKMSRLRSLLRAFSGRKGNTCGREGFVYGYVLVFQNDRNEFAYTCGAGSSPADELFNFLLKTVE